jgi:hypothetical protein
MKKLSVAFFSVFVLLSPIFAYAAIYPYALGGTATGTPSIGQLVWWGTSHQTGVATTSVGCSGTVSCSPFTAIGPSPITITGSGGGFLALASSTIGDGTQTGGLTINGGATTTGTAYFAGKVGIGTTTSPFLLSVSTDQVADTKAVVTNYNSAGRAVFGGIGNLGNGAYVESVGPTNGSVTAWRSGGVLTTDWNNLWMSAYQPSGSIHFQTGGIAAANERMTILSGGNVGIGNTSPAYPLDVAGFINTDQFSGYKQAGLNLLYSSTTNQSVVVGQTAGTSIYSTSTILEDTVVGYGALNAIQGHGNTLYAPYRNTAIGYNAMHTATSTTGVTAIGFNALASLNDVEDASGNFTPLLTAVGSSALQNDTLGIWNTAVGANALNVNTTGSSNNAFGANALQNNTTGGGNEGIGFAALQNLVSGSGNVAIGSQALQVDTGSSNIGIGEYSGFFNTSGGSNTFLGFEAGGSVGSKTDANSVIDTNMTFLGAAASRDQNGLASTSVMTNSAAIGANAKVGASNSIVLGGNTSATDVNVGIGTSTPYAQLSIQALSGDTDTTLFAIASSTASATTTLFSISNTGAITVADAITSTGSRPSTFPYASTTALTVNGNEVSGQRYLTMLDSTSTTWTATSSDAQVVAPFTGTLSSVSCSTATSSTDTTGTYTLNVQVKVGATNVLPMLNASTTKGTITFTSGNTFSAGNTIEMDAGTPANTPTKISCTAIATGY